MKDHNEPRNVTLNKTEGAQLEQHSGEERTVS